MFDIITSITLSRDRKHEMIMSLTALLIQYIDVDYHKCRWQVFLIKAEA